MASRSRSFDRAAPFYDRTRGLSPAATTQLSDQLAGELRGRGRCLEIGVGTGRIAWPLHQRGVELVGVDLSRPMMAVLVEKADGAPFPLVQGDATALPLADASFGAGLASHVFHLIPDWPAALDELLRVVRPGGLLAISHGRRDGGDLGDVLLSSVRHRFRVELADDRAHHPGCDEEQDEVGEALAARGAHRRSLPEVPVERTATAGALIDGLEAGQWSWTWDVAPDALAAAAARTRAWAAAEYGPLDQPVVVRAAVRWDAFDLP